MSTGMTDNDRVLATGPLLGTSTQRTQRTSMPMMIMIMMLRTALRGHSMRTRATRDGVIKIKRRSAAQRGFLKFAHCLLIILKSTK